MRPLHLRMDVDRLLQRIKVNGRGLSRDRLHWWLIIALTRLFGREVEIEDSGGKRLRILPIVWNRQVHLLGAEHDYLQADFSFQYCLRLRRAPEMTVTPGRAIAPSGKPATKPVHAILCHLPPSPTLSLLRHAQRLGPDYTIVLAYGGTRGHFDGIDWPAKVFIEDESLRGPSYAIAYGGLARQLRDYLKQNGLNPDWIFVADYDLVPLQNDYLAAPIRLMTEHGAGLGGKLVRDLSQSNSLFLCQAMERGQIDASLNGPGRQPIYHCLGCGLLFFGECLNTLFDGEPGLAAMNFELGALTSASKKGFRLLSFDKVGPEFASVRFRPAYTVAEALAAAATGAPFIHPLKEAKPFLEQWKGPAPT